MLVRAALAETLTKLHDDGSFPLPPVPEIPGLHPLPPPPSELARREPAAA